MTDKSTWFIFHAYGDDQNGLKLIAKAEISCKERDALFDSNRKIKNFSSSQNIINSVYANRNDVLKGLVGMGAAYLNKIANPKAIMDQASFELARQFANMCSLFRSFLDHFDRYFVNQFGKNSDKYLTWRRSLSDEYDNTLAYRIVYMMRNYIQHQDMLPLSLSISQGTGEEGISVRVDIELDILRQEKHVRNKLKCNDKEISLFTVIEDWIKSFDRIVANCNLIRVAEIASDAELILNVRKNLTLIIPGKLQ